MELREYLRACRRRWAWIVVPVVLAMGAAVALALTAAPAYRSSTVLFVTTTAGDPDTRASRLNSYIALLTGPRVAETVIADLDLPLTTREVQDRIGAQVQDGTDLLVVTATDPSADRSRAIVTAATTALVGLAGQLDAPGDVTDGPAPSVKIAQEPVTTREPDDLVRNVVFSAVLGLLIGAVAVAVREATRRTVGDEDDLRRLGLGSVGVISLDGPSGRGGYPGEALAEAFRRLRTLLNASPAGGARGTSLLVTGSNPQEGTTAVACGLAIAMAETGARVVLVDANLRTPGVGRYLSLGGGEGLAEVLAGTAGVSTVLQDALDGRLTVLPSGEHPADPGEALASSALDATIRTLAERFDVVLVDAPPLHAVADAVVLSKVTDSTLLVVRAHHTRTADVRRSADLLERVGARLAGAVLNALPRKLPAASAWHRGTPVAWQSEDELISGLFGDDDGGAGDEAHIADPDGDEAGVVARVPSTPVRGRARVVTATLVTDDEQAGDPAGDGGAARGQARVVVITDAQHTGDVPHPAKPADGSSTKPVNGSPAKPADGSSTKPADGSSAKPVDGSSVKPVNGSSPGKATVPVPRKPDEERPDD